LSEHIRVLIADDHNVVRGGLRALLETEEGIDVIAEASDGVEAVLKARAFNPDVILLDLVMPQMDGVEAFGAMHHHAPDVPVVIMSGFAGNLNFDRFAEAKPAALLAKPFTRETLQARLEVILGRN